MREAQIVSYNDGGVEPRFLKMPDVRLPDFKFDSVLPCYRLKRGNFSFAGTLPAAGRYKPNDSSQFFTEKEFWKNYEGSPVQINILGGGRTVFVNNVSDRTVASYVTACVANEEKPYKFSDIVEENGNLSPQTGSFSSNSDGTNSLRNRFGICYRKNAHLAVIKVSFEDGSAGSLK
jgi:hypothetical protein